MKESLQRRVAQKQQQIAIDMKKATKHAVQNNVEGFIKFALQVNDLNYEKKVLEEIIINL